MSSIAIIPRLTARLEGPARFASPRWARSRLRRTSPCQRRKLLVAELAGRAEKDNSVRSCGLHSHPRRLLVATELERHRRHDFPAQKRRLRVHLQFPAVDVRVAQELVLDVGQP